MAGSVPQSYRTLGEMFGALDNVLVLLRTRRKPATFASVRAQVQSALKRDFTLKHLAHIVGVFQEAFSVSWVRNASTLKMPDADAMLIEQRYFVPAQYTGGKADVEIPTAVVTGGGSPNKRVKLAATARTNEKEGSAPMQQTRESGDSKPMDLRERQIVFDSRLRALLLEKRLEIENGSGSNVCREGQNHWAELCRRDAVSLPDPAPLAERPQSRRVTALSAATAGLKRPREEAKAAAATAAAASEKETQVVPKELRKYKNGAALWAKMKRKKAESNVLASEARQRRDVDARQSLLKLVGQLHHMASGRTQIWTAPLAEVLKRVARSSQTPVAEAEVLRRLRLLCELAPALISTYTMKAADADGICLGFTRSDQERRPVASHNEYVRVDRRNYARVQSDLQKRVQAIPL